MVGLLVMIILLGIMFCVICELISAMAGIIFIGIAAYLILKIGKDLFNKK